MNRHLYTYELIYKAEQETFKVTDSFEIMKKAAKYKIDLINEYNRDYSSENEKFSVAR